MWSKKYNKTGKVKSVFQVFVENDSQKTSCFWKYDTWFFFESLKKKRNK